MKLRIRGNTLRLRVSKSELATVLKRGSVQDAIRFGPRTRLVYRLEAAAGNRFGAELAGDSIPGGAVTPGRLFAEFPVALLVKDTTS